MDADEKLDSVPSLKQEGNQLFQVYNSGVYIIYYAVRYDRWGGGERAAWEKWKMNVMCREKDNREGNENGKIGSKTG